MSNSTSPLARALIGQRLREHRAAAGLSLSELARRAGVGKGTLSEIEAGTRNPTIETLYALTGPLGIPMTALIGEADVRIDAEGGMRSYLLDVQRFRDRVVETFRLEFPPGARHESPAHPAGAHEQLIVLDGDVTVGPNDAPASLQPGESFTFAAQVNHRYLSNFGATAVLIITTPSVAAGRGDVSGPQ